MEYIPERYNSLNKNMKLNPCAEDFTPNIEKNQKINIKGNTGNIMGGNFNGFIFDNLYSEKYLQEKQKSIQLVQDIYQYFYGNYKIKVFIADEQIKSKQGKVTFANTAMVSLQDNNNKQRIFADYDYQRILFLSALFSLFLFIFICFHLSLMTFNNQDITGNIQSRIYQRNDPKNTLNTLKNKNDKRIIIGHLNINHLENKFLPLVSLVKDKLDIFLISETKIDESFPTAQFLIDGYTNPFRRDRDKFGGGLCLYIRDDIPCKQIKLKYTLPLDIECLFIEIRFYKNKYILVGGTIRIRIIALISSVILVRPLIHC